MRKILVFCEKSGKNEQKKGFFAEVDKELPIFICWCAIRNTVHTVTSIVERYPYLFIEASGGESHRFFSKEK